MNFWEKRSEFLNNLDSERSRPSTAKGRMTSSSTPTANIIPTSSWEVSRPGTSSGKRHILTNSSSGSGSSILDLDSIKHDEILNRHISSDNLLRIMHYDRIQRESEAILCTEKGDLSGLKSLLLCGLDIHTCNGLNGHSLLHLAASRGHSGIIAELVRLQMNVDMRNDTQETPLHVAVYAGHILVVDQLIDYGADIDAVNNDHETCLFYAARKSFPAIIRLLIQRGIDMSIRDAYDELAVDHVSQVHAKKAFETSSSSAVHNTLTRSTSHTNNSGGRSNINEYLSSHGLYLVFEYLSVSEIMVAARICTKWHRVTEHPHIWQRLGVRRWEIALQSSLGFSPTATSSFSRPKQHNHKNNPGNKAFSSSSSNSLSLTASKSNKR